MVYLSTVDFVNTTNPSHNVSKYNKINRFAHRIFLNIDGIQIGAQISLYLRINKQLTRLEGIKVAYPFFYLWGNWVLLFLNLFFILHKFFKRFNDI